MKNKETIAISGRKCTVYADAEPCVLMIQPADSHELEMLDKEVEHIKALTAAPFAFAVFEVTDWNSELSPWTAPPVFGNEPFGSGAGDTLAFIENTLIPEIAEKYSLRSDIPVILGGYSLAGLFALWTAYSSSRFQAVAAASPSVWFPGWIDHISERTPFAKSIYLSLGRKEEKARNKTMAAVGDNIRTQHEILKSLNISTILEWNEGNHFTEPELRTAKGFAWCCENTLK